MLLLGCSSQTKETGRSETDTANEVTVASSVVLQTETRDMLTEALADCLQAAMVDDYLYLCHTESGTVLTDERDASSTSLGAFTTLAGVRTPAGDTLLALDGDLYTYVASALVALEMPIPVPITDLTVQGGKVWLWGGGRLFRWSDDEVWEISLPDHPTIYSYAATEDRLYLAVPWLIETSLVDGGLEVQSVSERPVSAMATDASDNLWTVTEGELFMQRTGEPARHILMPEPVTTVTGPTVWIRGERHAYRYSDTRLSEHRMRSDGWLGVDGYGRLLEVHKGVAKRHSIGRPVVVTGLSESLMVQETALLLPSDPQSLSGLQVWLDTEELEVSTNPWTVTLDPETMTDGVHRLRFFCQSELGDSHDEYSVWVEALPEVSWPQIEEISNAHCVGCHGGTTLTDLSTKDDWERLIDPIIYQVSIQSMPQNGPYLSDDQIALIRGWKQGGFQ